MYGEQRQKLFNQLISDGLLKEDQVAEIENLSQINGKNLRDVLVSGGFVEEEKLNRLMAENIGLPYVNLTDNPPDSDIMKLIPQKLVEEYQVVCFNQEDKQLSIALADPDNFNAREALDVWVRQQGYAVEYYLCSMSSWQNAMSRYGAISEKVEEVLGEVEGETTVESLQDEEVEKIDQVIKKAPVSKIVNLIFLHAVKNKASDIHIEPNFKETRVRYRIDGALQTILVLPISIHDSIIARVKVLARLKIDETRVPQDGRIKLKLNNRDIDFRVATMPLLGKEKVTLRLLDTSGGALALSDLGFSQDFIKVAEEAYTKPYGMFLITGPTGSGKSTTLYSILSVLNKEGVNIVTLEDPIEYYTKGVNQAQIRPDVGFTFASGLRSLLRQDPDIIMVGEIRDNETAEMSIHAALTGHMLFSTLHTNNAVGAIPRLLDMKVEPFLLASTLSAVVAQRLARRICTKCKAQRDLPKEIQQKIKQQLELVDPGHLPENFSFKGELKEYYGKGCPVCKDTGYHGRVVIAEIIPVSDKLRKIISEGYDRDAVDQEVRRLKVVSLLQDGLIKVIQGTTTAEDVYRVAAEIEDEF